MAVKGIRPARGTFIQRSREESSEQKALWHNVQGAGKSRVKREFFALNGDDVDAIERLLVQAISERV